MPDPSAPALALYQGAFEASAVGMAICTLGGRIVEMNPSALRLFGLRRDEALGRTSVELGLVAPTGQPDPAELAAAVLDRHKRGAGPGVFERSARTTAGDPLSVTLFMSTIELAGEPLMVCTFLDVTRLRRAEREQGFMAELAAIVPRLSELEEVPERVAALVARHLADFCVLETTEIPGRVGRLAVGHRNAAAAAAALQGVRLDRRRLGSSPLDTEQPALFGEDASHQLESIATTEPQRQALREVAATSLMALPLLVRDARLGTLILGSGAGSRPFAPRDLAFAQEVAHRISMKLDNAMLLDRARRALQARDELFRIVAHDLRHPLANLLAHANLLEKPAPPSPADSPKDTEALWVRQHLSGIRASAARLDRLIGRLFKWTGMESGRFAIQRDTIPAAGLVAEVVEAHQPLASSAALELRADLEEGGAGLPAVWGDRDLLLEVFENLLSNAFKLTGAGGRIGAGAASRGGDVLFWVADTGPGIAAAALPGLFDAAAPETRGLGLSIVRGIVEAHGGRAWAESVPARGSTFYFTVPAAPPAAASGAR